MDRTWRYILSIVAAILPLAVFMVAYQAFYTLTGYGSPPVWNESLAPVVMPPPPEVDVESTDKKEELRWRGTEEEPIHMLVIGTSPTSNALRVQDTKKLKTDLGVETTIIARQGFPIDRYFDFVRMLEHQPKFDILLIGYPVAMTCDEHVAFREQSFGDRFAWHGTVFDSDIRGLHDEIIKQETGTEVQRDSPSQDIWDAEARQASAIMQKAREDANRLRGKKSATPEIVPYRSSASIWDAISGAPDISKFDRQWLRTNYLATLSLEKLAAYCREKGMLLIVYVPPRGKELRSSVAHHTPNEKVAAKFSLVSLAIASRRLGFTVLDYDKWSDDDTMFKDGVHLSPLGAHRFSPQFFSNLQSYLSTKGADASYIRVSLEPASPGR
ncbi:MAG: hypothetical protein NXI22_10605 [bacterium]|nr:hypothetical protein [bacterium]